MTIDTSGKARQVKPAATVRQSEPAPTPKSPAQGENVAAIEARVNAGETINLSDLAGAIKKDKQAAQPGKAAQTQPARTYSRGKSAAKPAAPEKPSIREELAAGKKQLASQKSAPPRSQTQNTELGA